MVVLNPGTIPDEGYVRDVATGPKDFVFTFEDSAANYLTATFPAWMNNYPVTKFGHLVLAANSTQFDQLLSLTKTRRAGYGVYHQRCVA
jgi:hypothetical protein